MLMSSVNNMMKSGKKILGISSSSLWRRSQNIANKMGMGSTLIINKNFSAASESTTSHTQEKGDQVDILSDPKFKPLKDATANVLAFSLLTSIEKIAFPPSAPSPTVPKSQGKVKFMFDDTGMHLTLDVSNIGKEHLEVSVTSKAVLVSSTMEVAATGKELREIIEMPQLCIYDPDQVTGRIIEGGALKVSFPYSKQEKEISSFKVNLV